MVFDVIASRALADGYRRLKFDCIQRSPHGAVVYVNGERIEIPKDSITPEITVLEFLRNTRCNPSVKLGCGEGGCGACTVTASYFDERSGEVHHRAVNACLTPLLSLHGAAITTANGICSTENDKILHPIQQTLSDTHGSQCGFCTPGIIMSLYSKWMDYVDHVDHVNHATNIRKHTAETPHTDRPNYVKRRSSVTFPRDIEDALDGNLCRCTGYRPILDGVRRFLQIAELQQGESSLESLAKRCVQGRASHGTGGNSVSASSVLLAAVYPHSQSVSQEEKAEAAVVGDLSGGANFSTSVARHSPDRPLLNRLSTPTAPEAESARHSDLLRNSRPTPSYHSCDSRLFLSDLGNEVSDTPSTAGGTSFGDTPEIEARDQGGGGDSDNGKKLVCPKSLGSCDDGDMGGGVETDGRIGGGEDGCLLKVNMLSAKHLRAGVGGVQEGEGSCMSAKRRPESGKSISAVMAESLAWMVAHERSQLTLSHRLRLTPLTNLPLYFKGRHLGREAEWLAPTSTLDCLIAMAYLTETAKRFRLVAGNTERHIERVYKRNHTYPMTLLSTARIKEMLVLKWSEEGVTVGSAVPISDIISSFTSRLDGLRGCPPNTAFGGAGHTVSLDGVPPECLGQARVLAAYIHQARWFAGTQIRNVATLGGNIATASPISDLNPLHMALGVTLNIAKLRIREHGQLELNYRQKRIDDKFFLKYRTTDLHSDELIVSICIPFYSPRMHTFGFKQCRRREDDTAIVNAAMRVELEESVDSGSQMTFKRVSEIAVVYGGMAPTPLLCSKYMAAWVGKVWNMQSYKDTLTVLQDEILLPPGTPGGMIQYRMRLARHFAAKFFLQVCEEGGIDLGLMSRDLYKIIPHPTYRYHHVVSKGLQYEGRRSGLIIPSSVSSVSRSNKHLAGDLHVAGRAAYVDDAPRLSHELSGVLVTSTVARGRILSVKSDGCAEVKGYHSLVTWQHVKGKLKIGPLFIDEPVFAVDEVFAVGQPIAMVLAETHEAAREAASRVTVTYEALPAILSMEDAIASRSFFDVNFEGTKHLAIVNQRDKDMGHDIDDFWDALGIPKGDPLWVMPRDDAGMPIATNFAELEQSVSHTKGAVLVVQGTTRMGGQEHFYLETQGCRVVPLENDEIEVTSSTQDPTKTQTMISLATGIPKHRIVVKCKRMGGGFGGKETRASVYAAMTAVAAKAVNRAVRLILDRDVDFQVSGQRHSFLGVYRVAVDRRTHKLLAADLQLYNDAGWSADLSVPVLERALFHCENSYFIPNLRVVGRCCRTNLPSNTAFRGFGGPQGMFLAETYMERLAFELKVCVLNLRRANIYRLGDFTHYNMPIEEDTLARLFDEIVGRSEYFKRKAEIDKFNSASVFVKRAISVVPVKFGLSFTKAFMNQAGALVHVYTDGTILVSHTGTEMGQGLHTKVAQVAATEFNVPINSIFIAETATDKAANGSPTAASSGSDLNGYATLLACRKIASRLRPYMEREREALKSRLIEDAKRDGTCVSQVEVQLNSDDNRTAVMKAAAQKAYFERVNLSANGFYSTPNINYSFLTNSGRPFHYFTYGICCSEVEVDTLTGDYRVIRCDIVQDAGISLNPAIDIGQVEGAFTQGLGLFTMEELVTLPNGAMFTKGPSTYKIPCFGDVPVDFRVFLLENNPNPASPSVHSSKGVGEPPLFLASSIYFGIKEAVSARRLDPRGVELLEVEFDESDIFEAKKASPTWMSLPSPATAERICNAAVYGGKVNFTT